MSNIYLVFSSSNSISYIFSQNFKKQELSFKRSVHGTGTPFVLLVEIVTGFQCFGKGSICPNKLGFRK